MAYKYFCTECGQENSAETVLFDMGALLTQNGTDTLNIIKLRMTGRDLEKLIDSGKPSDDQYNECELRFGDLVEYLASPYSCDAPELLELTISDLEDYFETLAKEAPAQTADPFAAAYGGDPFSVNFGAPADPFASADPFAAGGDLLGNDIFSENNAQTDIFGGQAQAPAQQAPAKSTLPDILKPFLKNHSGNTSREMDEILLRQDLETIYRLFMTEDGAYHFKIKRHTSRDDKKEMYLDGFWLNGTAIDNVRVCSRCRQRIFAKAGAAEHKVVSFIGETAAGKTSTILSLTHYAMHGLNEVGNGNPEVVWQNNPNIKERKLFNDVISELLKGKENELESDLNWFTFGVAPRKTEAGKREDAYHSTLLLQDKKGKRMIVSLMDLPGELFNDGKVDEDKVASEFSAALSSSAFVICFDTRTVTTLDITNMINFSAQMQDLRIARLGAGQHYVPSMILFTMADEASQPESTGAKYTRELYMLDSERKAMQDPATGMDSLYDVVRNVYGQNPMLKESFYAIMRCGAFGHMVPTTLDVSVREPSFNDNNRIADVDAYNRKVEKFNLNAYTDEDLAACNRRIADDDEYNKLILVYDYNRRTEEYNKTVDAYNKGIKENRDKQLKRVKAAWPKPNQMDLLMQWVLYVTGSLPCDVTYRTRAAEHILEKYYLTGTPYRTVNPGSGNSAADADIDEALARQMLFINPGRFDLELIRSLNNTEEEKGAFGKAVQKLFGSSVEGSTAYVRKKMKSAPDTNASEEPV